MTDRKRVVLLIGVALVALAIVAMTVLLVAQRVIVPGTAPGPQGLSKAEAERLLRASRFMAETTSTKLVLYRNRLFPASDLIAEHNDMVKFLDLGLVEVKPDKVLWGKPIGARFVLTPEGERAAAGWQHTWAPGGEEAWTVPTACKGLVKVLLPVTHQESAECDFTWKWTANKIGEKAGAPKSTETSRASFHRQDDRQWLLDEASIMQMSSTH